MSHARQTIREAIATLVTGLTTTGARVYQTRFYRLGQNQLPCLLVYTLEETIERSAMTINKTLVRNLTVRVEGAAEAVANLDDTLDTISAEVEAALSGQLPAGVEEFYLNQVQINLSTEGERPVGAVGMDFICRFRQTEGTPSEIL